MLDLFCCQVFCYQDLIFRDRSAVWIFRDKVSAVWIFRDSGAVWFNVLVVKIMILEIMLICVEASLLDMV